MQTCACGQQFNTVGNRCPQCAALHALSLEPGATSEDIRSAYLTLAKVWHPDRFENDVALRRKAGEKLKEINAAFQFLSSSGYGRAGTAAPKPRPKPEQKAPTPPKPANTQNEETVRDTAPRTPPQPSPTAPQQGSAPRPPRSREFKNLLRIAVTVAIVGFGKYLWQTAKTPSASKPPTAATPAVTPLFPPTHSTEHPTQTTAERNESDNTRPNRQVREPSQPHPDKSQPEQQPKSDTEAVKDELPYFTVGSTKHDVIRLDGTPTAFNDRVFEYGLSRVYFRNGVVTTWDISPLNPLHARLKPSTPVATRQRFYTVGSTRDEVLSAQGTPTEFSGNVLVYGLSKVFLKDGRVISWEVSPLNPLNVRLAPTIPTTSRGYFTVGSSRDEVLAVQGTPTEFSETVFSYGLSKVFFRSGRVVSWDVSPLNPLKARLQ